VEASTVGSVILAALMLKLGLYGIIRFNLPLVNSLLYFQPIAYSLGITSIFYASLVSIRQLDMKRIVAYSSIVHMNIAMLGLLSNTSQGKMGGVVLILSHGLVSALLFFLIGALYDRAQSKLIFYYSGLTAILPTFSTCLFLGSIANISFPLTFSFIGELLAFVGLFSSNSLLGIIVIMSSILSSISSM